MNVRIPLLAVLIGLFVVGVSSAQIKTITKIEFDAAKAAAFDAAKNKTRRVVTKTQSFDGGKKEGSESLTEEFVPPDSRRSIFSARSGNKVLTSEIIEVGSVKYKRTDGGIWSTWKGTTKPVYQLRGIPSDGEPKENSTYTITESKLNGRTVQILASVSNKAYGSLPGRTEHRIWIGKDGLVLRTEEIISEDSADDVVFRSVSTVEYDPKGLKIEAPIK